MRNAVFDELLSIARENPRVMLLTADLGFGVLDEFARELPAQFFNVGVAEQAMVGMATGMAEAGLEPYCYSIATFAFLRPFEFIRNGPVAHRLPVRVIGVGAGTDYTYDGLTHYALEDLALARTQPGLVTFAPTTDASARELVREAHELDGPAYLRLSRASPPAGADDARRATPTAADVVILVLGAMQHRAEAIAGSLERQGVSAVTRAVTRFDSQTDAVLASHLELAPVCITIENHYAVGGLGSAVAEAIATRGLATRLVIDAVSTLPTGAVGSTEFMEARLYRPIAELVDSVARLMGEPRARR